MRIIVKLNEGLLDFFSSFFFLFKSLRAGTENVGVDRYQSDTSDTHRLLRYYPTNQENK